MNSSFENFSWAKGLPQPFDESTESQYFMDNETSNEYVFSESTCKNDELNLDDCPLKISESLLQIEESTDNKLRMRKLKSEEIQILDNLAIKCKRDWSKISLHFKKMTGKVISPEMLRKRFKRSAPQRKKGGKFTDEEDLLLKKYVEIDGFDWLKISSHFPDRTPLSLRNRFYSNRRANKFDYQTLGKSEGKPMQSKATPSDLSQAHKPENLKLLVRDIELEDQPQWLMLIESLIF